MASFIFLALHYLILFLMPHFHDLIVVGPLFLALFKATYWPTYHADMAYHACRGEIEKNWPKGRWTIWVAVIAPLIGGIIVHFFGFAVLFILMAILLMAAGIPPLFTKERVRPVKFNYRNCFKRLVAKSQRVSLVSGIGVGEELIAGLMVPILIYLLVKNYFYLGLIVSFVTAVMAGLILVLPRMAKMETKRGKTVLANAYELLTGFLSIFVTDMADVFQVTTFSKFFTRGTSREMICGRGSKKDIMERVVSREQNLALGKMIGGAIILLVMLSFPNIDWDSIHKGLT